MKIQTDFDLIGWGKTTVPDKYHFHLRVIALGVLGASVLSFVSGTLYVLAKHYTDVMGAITALLIALSAAGIVIYTIGLVINDVFF